MVQRMTTGEAEKLLTAKGYLKSRYQAMIGTKLPGRVEKMCVQEGMKVKKGGYAGDPRAQRSEGHPGRAGSADVANQAELEEAHADLWEKDRENKRVTRLYTQKSATPEESEKAVAAQKKAAHGSRPWKPASN